jgi:hypothetical protein
MSSGRLVVALGAALLGTGPAAAQDSTAAIRRMEIRLDSLRGIVALAESVQGRLRETDTVSVGALRIVTSAALRPVYELALPEAWDSLLSRFGPALADHPPLGLLESGPVVVRGSGAPDPHELARGWVRMFADQLWREQDATIVGWLHGSFPSGPLGEQDLVELSARMAVVPARPNPGCLAGNVSDCATALGLGVGPDTLSAWYDSTAWPGLAWQSRESVPRSEWTLRNLCSVRNYSACRAVLVRGPITAPVGASGRRLLVQLALEAGGPEAFRRLNSDPAAPLERRLEAAAGLPLDTLLGRWIDVVHSAMPDAQRPTGVDSVATLAWCAALLLLALRGPRWR